MTQNVKLFVLNISSDFGSGKLVFDPLSFAPLLPASHPHPPFSLLPPLLSHSLLFPFSLLICSLKRLTRKLNVSAARLAKVAFVGGGTFFSGIFVFNRGFFGTLGTTKEI
jgi:hypothetical protein